MGYKFDIKQSIQKYMRQSPVQVSKECEHE